MKKFQVGIVGAGFIARDHARSLRRLPRTAGISCYDSNPANAKLLADEAGAKIAGSVRELVEGCDIVWICTPPFARQEVLAEATRAGKAIFCEKPIALNAKEIATVKSAVGKSKAPFFMGQSGRYSYFFQKIKELVADGAIGQITSVWSTRLGNLDPANTPAWRMDDELGGGTIIELGVHELDYIRWIGGEWQSVYAKGSSETLLPGKFQDSVSALGTLQSGAIARLDISWASPRYLWQRGVEGVEGSIFFDDSNVREVVLNRPGKSPEIHKTGDWQNKRTKENLSLREQAIAVLEALGNDEAPPVTLTDGMAAVQAALAIRESAATGKVVKIG